jgi:hypothetical protein
MGFACFVDLAFFREARERVVRVRFDWRFFFGIDFLLIVVSLGEFEIR